ncbi:MAG: right-handed parallel beta-helix repeat-containing protein [Chitinophagales bacterium]|nr:right-handed parallel beta-helix repeat-containing protein [Chitinophagales bacterium]MDW8428568.1 right-handed parallel beta-helix repeat-containing protein [Chitinophagales bacterium]
MMRKHRLLALVAMQGVACGFAQPIIPQPGMRITASCTFVTAEYVLDASPDLNAPLIIIEGEDIVVDFQQATLRSSIPATRPDLFQGVAVLIQNSRRITLRGAHIHGYKVAVRAVNVQDLVIESCDLSYNYRQRLQSTPLREEISDWLSFHRNDNDEWLRYGAALYLRNCSRAIIRNNRVTGGQCALLMTECHESRVYGNEFTFNSALGIGLYRSSRNLIYENKLSFNIRGYSHLRYNRGQDSAGILMYEQSNENVIAGNQATHCGDGLFLWAGQYTMDTGQGGCNDNLIVANDFSDASNNGIEATFSKNLIVGNRIHRCDYGLWGGYSYGTLIAANDFAQNRVAVAIEHGQNNKLLANAFFEDGTAIQLWAREQQPGEWKLVRYRNTESRQYHITHNVFNNVKNLADIRRTSQVTWHDNWANADFNTAAETGFMQSASWTSDSAGLRVRRQHLLARYQVDTLASLPPPHPLAGKHNIRITEWGPYDFKRPLLWLDSIGKDGRLYLSVLGPDGKWRLRRAQGLELTKISGIVPDTIQARIVAGYNGPLRLTCAYLGPPLVDEFGRTFKPDILRPFDFTFVHEPYPITWHRQFYRIKKVKFDNAGATLTTALRGQPVHTDTTDDLYFVWWKVPYASLAHGAFALKAEGTVVVPQGEYEIHLTADDIVRLYVDDRLLLDVSTKPQSPYADQYHHVVQTVLGGAHRLKIEYAQLDGLAALSLRLRSKTSHP